MGGETAPEGAMVRWTAIQDGKSLVISSPADEPVIGYIQQHGGIHLQAPCSGRGKCGKCVITVDPQSRKSVEPSDFESLFLSGDDLASGTRLACYTAPREGMEIRLPDSAEMKVHTGLTEDFGIMSDRFDIRHITLPPSSLEHQESISAKLAGALEISEEGIGLSAMRNLPATLTDVESASVISAVLDRGASDKVVKLCAMEDVARLRIAAVDIGTTTIAAYLQSLDGRIIATASAVNPQTRWGADVVSRLAHAKDHAEGLSDLHAAVSGEIDKLLLSLVREDGNHEGNLILICLAGNTSMMHFLARLDSRHMAQAPFIPMRTDGVRCLGVELGLTSFPDCATELLPSISAYVGADISAGMLVSAMDRSVGAQLLVDLGTNGEIALAANGKLYATSTAAGPAFEGAGLSCGCGSVPGAIDHVELEDDGLSISTIGDQAPVGICGSGILDIIAACLEAGIVDETGRILDEDEARYPAGAMSLTEINGAPAISIGEGNKIYVTQQDIREVQLAKGAVLAGILTLVGVAGIPMDEIEYLWLAGGFGTYMRSASAIRIGLLPDLSHDKLQSAGNSSASGAVLCGRSADASARIRKLVSRTESIELSGRADFQMHYMNAMFFAPVEA